MSRAGQARKVQRAAAAERCAAFPISNGFPNKNIVVLTFLAAFFGHKNGFLLLIFNYFLLSKYPNIEYSNKNGSVFIFIYIFI